MDKNLTENKVLFLENKKTIREMLVFWSVEDGSIGNLVVDMESKKPMDFQGIDCRAFRYFLIKILNFPLGYSINRDL